MKEKDLIKLTLIEKNIGHEEIKKNILSEELPAQTVKKHPQRRRMAPAAIMCALLLTVCAVSLPLMLNSDDKPVPPPESIAESRSESNAQSAEASSADTSSEIIPDRKVVYGTAGEATADNAENIGYGTLRIDSSLTNAMEDIGNADALFAVGFRFGCEKILYCSPDDPSDIAFKKAKEDRDAYREEKFLAENDFANLYKITLPEKIDFTTIPKDIDEQLLKEHAAEEKKLNEMKDDYERGIFYYSEQVRYLKERINVAKTDDQMRSEALAELDAFWNRIKNILDNYKAAQEKYNELYDARYTKYRNLFFKRNGLDYIEITNRYEKLLLTKNEILSLTVNEDEKVFLYLLPENPGDVIIVTDDA
jgi:hypothetical protein